MLESDKFINDKIDRRPFENFKMLVKPFRPSSQKIKEDTQNAEKNPDLMETIKKTK